METLSFGIDLDPAGQKSQGYGVGRAINLQPLTSLATFVKAFPRS